ncbi:hypothetical protein GCM10027161_67300 [Microbispora hainanensis]
MMTHRPPGRSPRPGGPQPLIIIILVLVLSFQAGYNPDQIRDVLTVVAVTLVTIAAAYALRGRFSE